jgi:hypothetical protein
VGVLVVPAVQVEQVVRAVMVARLVHDPAVVVVAVEMEHRK